MKKRHLATIAQITAFTGVMALCFQPLAEHYDFKKGIVKDEDGRFLFDKQGKAIMERDVIAGHKEQFKNDLKKKYGTNWKRVFHNPSYALKLAS